MFGFRFQSHGGVLCACLISGLIGLGLWSSYHKPNGPSALNPENSGNAKTRVTASTLTPSLTGVPKQPRLLSTKSVTPTVYAKENADLPIWAVRYGAEFWRPTQQSDSHVKNTTGGSPSSIQEIIERVDHSFISKSNFAEVQSWNYQARIDASGLHLIPNLPKTSDISDPSVDVCVSTAKISDEQQTYFENSPAAEVSRSLIGNTAQLLLDDASGIVEHFEARAQGMELTWVIPHALNQTGSLAIESDITGVEEARVENGAVHLLDANGTARLRIGSALAVDSKQNRWELAMTWAGNRLRVEVPASVLEQAAYPLAVDPWISPEYGMDQPVVSSISTSTQAAPSIAANSHATLVVWTHGKGDLTPSTISAARLTPDGVLLDLCGLSVAATANEQTTTSVAANENDFLVVWCAPKAVVTTDWDILAARVDIQGTVRNLPAICSVSSIQTSPIAAGNGTNYFIAWHDARNTGLYGTLLRQDGSLSATNGISLGAFANEQLFPAIASLNGNFLLVWQDYRKATSSLFVSDIYGGSHFGCRNPSGYQ